MIGIFCVSHSVDASNSPIENLLFQNNMSTRIIGGTEAEPGEFPSIVSLQDSSWGHFCAGSLIRSNWILTAAHCVKNPPLELKIVVGLHKLNDQNSIESFSAKKIIIHPEYNKKIQADFDFALIQLNSDSRFEPIEMNPSEIEIQNEERSIMVTTAGWGYTQEGGDVSNTLMKVQVPLVSPKRCEAAYRGKITDRMICAGLDKGGKDSCQGDSGGPLIDELSTKRKKLIGIVSWGEGCARPKKYGVYSKVNSAFDWVETQIRQNN